jgi:formate dehydrogenase major subunit
MKLPRLTEPLVRDFGKLRAAGDGRSAPKGPLRAASWDEALGRAAALFRASIERHGPRTFGMFSCSKATNEVNYMAQKFTRAVVGSNNIDSCNRT